MVSEVLSCYLEGAKSTKNRNARCLLGGRCRASRDSQQSSPFRGPGARGSVHHCCLLNTRGRGRTLLCARVPTDPRFLSLTLASRGQTRSCRKLCADLTHGPCPACLLSCRPLGRTLVLLHIWSRRLYSRMRDKADQRKAERQRPRIKKAKPEGETQRKREKDMRGREREESA